MLGPVEGGVTQHYQNALGEINRELRHPSLQRKIFSLAQASPKEIIRSRNITEIQQRALAFVPDELLQDIPADNNSYSLFQGFQATLPEAEEKDRAKKQSARNSRGQRLLEESAVVEDEATGSPIAKLRNEKERMTRRLEMMGVRKNMCSTEIHEIDHKIANLNSMRKIVLDRLAGLEQEEMLLEHEISEAEIKIEELQEQLDDDAALAARVTPTMSPPVEIDAPVPDSPAMDASFMSESIYQKLPSPKAPKRPKAQRRRTTHILHEHLQAGSKIRELQAHNDIISTLDFDVPFGTMVTAALDDTVRVWDLNAGRCIGLLEGHLSSVRCLQVEDNIVATGSMDASVRLWDLSQADYTPHIDSRINKLEIDFSDDDNDVAATTSAADLASTRATQAASMRDCPMFTLSAHVAEITALHFHNNTLISGSADKTLRQWDLAKGRCVQTLDVLWAAAQASSTISPATAASSAPAGSSLLPDLSASWRPTATGRVTDASADFVGALQCFDAALACGTADGLVRLWDLRSGQVHRSLVGHTGAVTCLQFDDVHLVTGSLDRSIRVCAFPPPFLSPSHPLSRACLVTNNLLLLCRSGIFVQAASSTPLPMTSQSRA